MVQSLIAAVKTGDIEKVSALLTSGEDVNQCDDQGWTPLNFASGKGNLVIVKLLIERGADPFKVGRDRRTPYMIALAAGREDVVKYLREVEDRLDPEKAKSFRPERKYCKAYHLRDLRAFSGWVEERIDWKVTNQSEQVLPDHGKFADDMVVFIHQDFTVTETMWHNENVIFNQISESWRDFCQQVLCFRVPTDLDLMPSNLAKT
jgi:uncharacterized protein